MAFSGHKTDSLLSLHDIARILNLSLADYGYAQYAWTRLPTSNSQKEKLNNETTEPFYMRGQNPTQSTILMREGTAAFSA